MIIHVRVRLPPLEKHFTVLNESLFGLDASMQVELGTQQVSNEESSDLVTFTPKPSL